MLRGLQKLYHSLFPSEDHEEMLLFYRMAK